MESLGILFLSRNFFFLIRGFTDVKYFLQNLVYMGDFHSVNGEDFSKFSPIYVGLGTACLPCRAQNVTV